MAKSKGSKSNNPGTETQEGKNRSPAAPPSKRARGILLGVMLVLILGAGLVTHRRRTDPARVWAQQFDQHRAQKLEQPLTACFGGTDGAAIRRLIPPIRDGRWPAPFATCRGSVLTEVLTAPMALAADLRGAPEAAERAKNRERGHLDRIRTSLQRLQTLSDFERGEIVPEIARDRIANALEDLAVEVDAERTAYQALVESANEAASWY
jgi:hypothetical protein